MGSATRGTRRAARRRWSGRAGGRPRPALRALATHAPSPAASATSAASGPSDAPASRLAAPMSRIVASPATVGGGPSPACASRSTRGSALRAWPSVRSSAENATLSTIASGSTRQRASSVPARSFHTQSVPWLTTHSKARKTSASTTPISSASATRISGRVGTAPKRQADPGEATSCRRGDHYPRRQGGCDYAVVVSASIVLGEIAILRGLRCSGFGIEISSTPFSKAATIASPLTPSGSVSGAARRSRTRARRGGSRP